MLIELAPGEFVDFIAQGPGPDFQRRFLDVLKDAWQRLPVDARKTILDYWQKRQNWYPRVGLGARVGNVSPVAMAGTKRDGFMAWFDSMVILDMPGKDPWAVLAVGEELAHAFMLASDDPTHTSDPPNENQTSPEFRAWYDAREDAATKVQFQWPFDPAIHADIVAWLKTKAAKPGS